MCWRIFEFKIQYRNPAVERINFHLEKKNTVTFPESINLRQLVHHLGVENAMFTEWMKANNSFEDARELTYTDFPTKWVWHSNVQ